MLRPTTTQGVSLSLIHFLFYSVTAFSVLGTGYKPCWQTRWINQRIVAFNLDTTNAAAPNHKRSQGAKEPWPPKFLENIFILSFKRRFSKQNSVIRLKSNILAPTKFLGWLRHCPQLLQWKYLCCSVVLNLPARCSNSTLQQWTKLVH